MNVNVLLKWVLKHKGENFTEEIALKMKGYD